MVVEDFHLIRPLLRPTEAQAVLLVDANAVLSLPVTGECFEAIAERAFEVDEIGCGMKDEQFGSRPSTKICRKQPGGVSQRELLGFLANESANHAMSNYTRNQRTSRQNVLHFGTKYRGEFEYFWGQEDEERGQDAHAPCGDFDRGVKVELDESAVNLILCEGFSPEYGARNLERVMGRFTVCSAV
jgi:hypothetical protein